MFKLHGNIFKEGLQMGFNSMTYATLLGQHNLNILFRKKQKNQASRRDLGCCVVQFINGF
jgi:hypothetical protein